MCVSLYTMCGKHLADGSHSADVATGTYILSVVSHDHVFDKVGLRQHAPFPVHLTLHALNAIPVVPCRRPSRA